MTISCFALAALVAAPATTPAQSSDFEPIPGLRSDSTRAPAATAGLDDGLESGRAQPLSLQEAIGLALSNNMALERAQIEREAARFDAISSWGAFDFVFDAQLQYSDSETEGNTSLFGGDVVESTDTRLDLDLTKPMGYGGQFALHFDTQQNRTTNQFFNAPELFQDGVRASYTQPLLRNAGTQATTSQQRISEITSMRRQEELREARQTLLHDVEVAYWELVAALQQLEVARSALELGRTQVTREQARVRAGDGTEVDVLQARTEVATRTETLLQAENDVAQRGDDLKRLVYADRDPARWERPIAPTSDLPSAESAPELPDWYTAFETALGRRPDLRNAQLDVDAARARLQRAESDRLYGLDLILTAASGAVDENYAEALGDTVDFEFPRYSAQLNYNMPLQNRTASGAERAARERMRGSQVALEEAEIIALQDVRRAIREVRFRAQSVQAATQSATLAQAQLDAEQKRLDADLSTTFQVLEFQQTLIESLSNRSRAAAEFAKSLVGLERARGTIGELPRERAPRR